MAGGRMRGAAGTLALALVVSGVLASSGETRADASTDAAIARYQAALAALAPLGNLTFRYVQSRVGPTRALAEEHRVYRRDDGAERNETVAINGTAVTPVIVRFSRQPSWPYDVRRFAVDTAAYDVAPLGPSVVAGKRVLGYSTVLAQPGDFAITGLYLDARRYLPVRETFNVSGSGCAGSGSIDFAGVGAAWLPVTVSVSCSLTADGPKFKEKIAFSDYAFPSAIPSDVLGGQP